MRSFYYDEVCAAFFGCRAYVVGQLMLPEFEKVNCRCTKLPLILDQDEAEGSRADESEQRNLEDWWNDPG